MCWSAPGITISQRWVKALSYHSFLIFADNWCNYPILKKNTFCLSITHQIELTVNSEIISLEIYKKSRFSSIVLKINLLVTIEFWYISPPTHFPGSRKKKVFYGIGPSWLDTVSGDSASWFRCSHNIILMLNLCCEDQTGILRWLRDLKEITVGDFNTRRLAMIWKGAWCL